VPTFPGYGVESDGGSKSAAEFLKTDIEICITPIENVVGAHLAQKLHLLSPPHYIGEGNRKPLSKAHQHASECACGGRLNDRPLPAEPSFFRQGPGCKPVDEHRRALLHIHLLAQRRHNCAEVTRYSAHMPPAMFASAPAHATRLPLRKRAIIPLPASTTVPLPSNPRVAGRGFLKP